MNCKNDDSAPTCRQLSGRIDYLLNIKRVKDPELMMTALENLSDLADACKQLIGDLDKTEFDWPQQNLIKRCNAAIERAIGDDNYHATIHLQHKIG